MDPNHGSHSDEEEAEEDAGQFEDAAGGREETGEVASSPHEADASATAVGGAAVKTEYVTR